MLKLSFSHPYEAVFDMDDDIWQYEGKMYAGMLDIEGFGSRKACEFYNEKEIGSKEQLLDFFQGLTGVTDLDTKKEIPVEDFLEMVTCRYREESKDTIQEECEAER